MGHSSVEVAHTAREGGAHSGRIRTSSAADATTVGRPSGLMLWRSCAGIDAMRKAPAAGARLFASQPYTGRLDLAP